MIASSGVMLSANLKFISPIQTTWWNNDWSSKLQFPSSGFAVDAVDARCKAVAPSFFPWSPQIIKGRFQGRNGFDFPLKNGGDWCIYKTDQSRNHSGVLRGPGFIQKNHHFSWENQILFSIGYCTDRFAELPVFPAFAERWQLTKTTVVPKQRRTLQNPTFSIQNRTHCWLQNSSSYHTDSTFAALSHAEWHRAARAELNILEELWAHVHRHGGKFRM